MAREYELTYAAKQPEQSILSCTQPAKLQLAGRIGTPDLFESEGWSNILALGDNLPILQALMQNDRVRGKVTLVYIDPPFSTAQEFRGGNSRVATISASNKDPIAYEDTLIGAEYLEFLRKRLVFLRELLADDGSIYVHIDWKKGHYVKVIMDELFGEERFINDIARIKCNPKNFERPAYGNIKDIILFYSKTDHYVWNEAKEQMGQDAINRLFPKIDTDGRKYTTVPLHAPGETKNGPTGQLWKGLEPPRGRHWRTHPDELTKLDEQGLIEWSSTGNPRRKIYADEVHRGRKKRQDVWEFKDPPYPSYPTEKNLNMLKVIVEASSNPGDIILDCFCGSGSTLVAAEELGRRWVGIDNSPLAIEATLRRLTALKNLRSINLYCAEETQLSKGIKQLVQQ